jgi:phosphohistidine phosphatase
VSPGSEHHRLLFVLRHAKAKTEPPRGGSDHERELNPRGRNDAAALGKRLARGDRFRLARRDLPSLALCSTAARTMQTAERVLDGWSDPPELRKERELYRADADDVLELLRTVDDDVRSVMVVGHNPTIAYFAEMMIDPVTPPRGSVDRQGFPTCALAVVRLPDHRWSKLAPGTATWARLFMPPY